MTDIDTEAKPFLKWAGGKTQLLDEFTRRIPKEMENGGIKTFVEPFVGGGAVFFHLNSMFSFEKCHIFDVNEELFLAYNVLKRDVDSLIECLFGISEEYLPGDENARKEYFYSVRDDFNRQKPDIDFVRYDSSWVFRAAQLIFLNRTCFNGLFRVNSKGWFNVPFGRYKNPKIVNPGVLRADSKLLSNTEIHHGDFEGSSGFIDMDSFVYFDPPYRPLNRTSSFTGYSRGGFDDQEQIRLAGFFKECSRKGARLMLSNSDPKNIDLNDDFFDGLYGEFSVKRVAAKRNINSDAGRRGEIKEIIVTNY